MIWWQTPDRVVSSGLPSWAVPPIMDCVLLPSAVNQVPGDCLTAQNTDWTAWQNCNIWKTGVFLRKEPRKTVTQKAQAILLLTHQTCSALQINKENELRASFTFFAAVFFFVLCYGQTQCFLLISGACFFFRSRSIMLATESSLLRPRFFSLRFHTRVR